MQVTNTSTFQAQIGIFSSKVKDNGSVFIINGRDYTKSFISIHPAFLLSLLGSDVSKELKDRYRDSLEETYEAAKRKQYERYANMAKKANKK